MFRQGKITEAIPFFEKAASLMSTDFHNASMLLTCYTALGDRAQLRRAAEMTLERALKATAQDATNGAALAAGAAGLAIIGEAARAKEWIQRALLLDPENISMRYNLACALANHLGDREAAIETLAPFFDRVNSFTHLKHMEADPDWDTIRDDPRFVTMLAEAKARLGLSGSAG